MEEIKNQFNKVFFKNYANFRGRASRSECWLYILGTYLIMSIVMFFIFILIILGVYSYFKNEVLYQSYNSNFLTPLSFVLMAIYLLLIIITFILFIPTLAVTIRRLHDTGKSGWYALLTFIPFVGSIIFYLLLSLQGQKGANQYGEDPRIKEYKEYLSELGYVFDNERQNEDELASK